MKQVHVFDIDGTITTSEGLLKDVTSYIGSKVELEDLVEYNIAESLHLMRFIDEGSMFDDVEFFKHYANNYLMNSPAHEGVLEYINRLKELGHEVWFLTARQTVNEGKTKVLFKNLGIPFHNVIHTDGAKNKYKYLVELNATHFYEDRPDTIEYVSENLKSINLFCVDYPYNRYVQDMENVTVIRSWNELLDPR